MKEVKVKLYQEENDDFIELWKVINPQKGEPKYYGRYTYADKGTWYYISDPLGYCEMDHAVKEDVVFILCDEDGKEYIKYSNADKNPLPKFDTVMKKEWKKVCENLSCTKEEMTKNFWSMCITGETTLELNKWLLTFKDPDLYQKEISEMNGFDINWTSSLHYHEIAYESVPDTEFEYLGHKYQFTKVTNKHDVCGVEWVEYLCTDSPYVMYDTYRIKNKAFVRNYGYLGSWFDKTNVGTMMDIRTAKEVVTNALLEIYPKEKEFGKLLYVNGNYCYEKSYIDVAESLIGEELHRDKIMELITNIRERTESIVFVSTRVNKEYVKEMYPGIHGYNYCLI